MNSTTTRIVFSPGRRGVLARGCALGAFGLADLLDPHSTAAAEPAAETRRIRFAHEPFICMAPQYLAEELLPGEGFSEWEYVQSGSRSGGIDAIADGRIDMTMWDAHSPIPLIDAGKPIVVLAGVHGGCYQLFANERVRSVRELQGKTSAIHYFGGGDHVLLSSMLANVGVDPRHEVNWVTGQGTNARDVFAQGKADAFVGFAQEPAELRLKKVGQVILDTAQDRPCSQYFCCVVVANRDFVAKNPVATKRALRAIMKSADVCASDPEKVARFLAAKLYETRYPIGLEVMKTAQYNRWRESNPEDTLRFHMLRLRDGGLIRSTPQKLIAQGTDWRFLDQIRKELKG